MFSRPVSHSVASRASPAVGGSINGSKGTGEQEWVSNQTSLVGREGGTINVGNTLTNTGAIIGSLNENAPMVINAKEIIVNDLKDKNYSKNAGFCYPLSKSKCIALSTYLGG